MGRWNPNSTVAFLCLVLWFNPLCCVAQCQIEEAPSFSSTKVHLTNVNRAFATIYRNCHSLAQCTTTGDLCGTTSSLQATVYTESSSTTNLFIAWSDLTFCSLTPIDDQYYSISPGICAEDPCLRYSCADCTSLPNCGFCGTLGKCLKGSPSSSDSFACPDWNWATPSKCCQFQTSCTECLTPSLGGACSYCSASNQCLPRSSSSCASNIDSCFGVNNCPNGFTGDCQNRAYQSRNVFQSQLSSTPAITFSPTGDGGVYFFEIHLRVQQYSDVSIAEFNGDGDGFVLKMRSSGFTEFVLFCNERIISTITSRTRLPLNDLTRIAVVLYGLDPPQCNVTTSSARMYIDGLLVANSTVFSLPIGRKIGTFSQFSGQIERIRLSFNPNGADRDYANGFCRSSFYLPLMRCDEANNLNCPTLPLQTLIPRNIQQLNAAIRKYWLHIVPKAENGDWYFPIYSQPSHEYLFQFAKRRDVSIIILDLEAPVNSVCACTGDKFVWKPNYTNSFLKVAHAYNMKVYASFYNLPLAVSTIPIIQQLEQKFDGLRISIDPETFNWNEFLTVTQMTKSLNLPLHVSLDGNWGNYLRPDSEEADNFFGNLTKNTDSVDFTAVSLTECGIGNQIFFFEEYLARKGITGVFTIDTTAWSGDDVFWRTFPYMFSNPDGVTSVLFKSYRKNFGSGPAPVGLPECRVGEYDACGVCNGDGLTCSSQLRIRTCGNNVCEPNFGEDCQNCNDCAMMTLQNGVCSDMYDKSDYVTSVQLISSYIVPNSPAPVIAPPPNPNLFLLALLALIPIIILVGCIIYFVVKNRKKNVQTFRDRSAQVVPDPVAKPTDKAIEEVAPVQKTLEEVPSVATVGYGNADFTPLPVKKKYHQRIEDLVSEIAPEIRDAQQATEMDKPKTPQDPTKQKTPEPQKLRPMAKSSSRYSKLEEDSIHEQSDNDIPLQPSPSGALEETSRSVDLETSQENSRELYFEAEEEGDLHEGDEGTDVEPETDAENETGPQSQPITPEHGNIRSSFEGSSRQSPGDKPQFKPPKKNFDPKKLKVSRRNLGIRPPTQRRRSTEPTTET